MAELRHPGPVVLFGSGETSQVGGRVFETVAGRMDVPVPFRIALLETPAGFEPNSAQVAGNIADFLRRRLENFRPEIEVVPARKRDTPFSQDDPDLLKGLARANLVFLGPGSPTYAVRQLRGSRAWQTVLSRHRAGATTVFASAAMIAAGALALPVYEIYKVGEDLHWREGLDFFGRYGLSLVFIPHWNNTDGGEKLDTGRCFMGRERFAELRALLPPGKTLVGIDENTALVMDLSAGQGEVIGQGAVTVIRSGSESCFAAPRNFDLAILGPFEIPVGNGDVTPAAGDASTGGGTPAGGDDSPPVPPEVRMLADEREEARARRDWTKADELRQRISALGWKISDTLAGYALAPRPPGHRTSPS
jgi:cyanophycinase-like exopeptidase